MVVFMQSPSKVPRPNAMLNLSYFLRSITMRAAGNTPGESLYLLPHAAELCKLKKNLPKSATCLCTPHVRLRLTVSLVSRHRRIQHILALDSVVSSL